MQGESRRAFIGRASRTQRAGPPFPEREHGSSLMETMVWIGIVALTIGLAAPSLLEVQDRYRLEGRASELATDLHYVRSQALARNQPLRISFNSDAAGTCYVLHTGAADDCSCVSNGTAQCRNPDNAIFKSVGFAAGQRISLHSNVISMLFDPGRGTTTPAGSITLTGASGKTIRQIVNIAGRTRTCSPEGSVSGYKTC